MSPSFPTVAVIGAGFSGTVTAVHLLRRTAQCPVRVVLLDRTGRVGRGVAYATASARHVLNVPAGRMSAFADDEDHFLRFAQGGDPSIVGGSFVPRARYGAYLAQTLAEAADIGARHGSRLEVRSDEVVDVAEHETSGDGGSVGLRLHLSGGDTLDVDALILAVGNFAPAHPPVDASSGFFDSPRYVRDPWAPGVLDALPADAPLLLVGTGLTMLDVAVELAARPRTAPIHAISRRGLVPLPHRAHGSPPSYGHLPPDLIACDTTAVSYLRAIRRHVRTVARDGIDWREVVASLRPVTPRLWATLPPVERRRFLRHARPYWDVHRHRVAPALYHALESLRGDATLQLSAGRLLAIDEAPDAVRVTWRRRGTATPESLRVAGVVNCTGPESDVRAVDEPLLRALLARGTARADALGLGLQVAPDGRLARGDGRAHERIWLAGPLLKGAYWEATAVPELRVHAARAARRCIDALVTTAPVPDVPMAAD